MRAPRVCLLLVAVTLAVASPVYAKPPLPKPPPSSLDKDFPFDPYDARPVNRSGSGPFADPVLGRPGLVTSPYAPDAGYVDVRGFKHGDEVRCPYTNHLFLVP